MGVLLQSSLVVHARVRRENDRDTARVDTVCVLHSCAYLFSLFFAQIRVKNSPQIRQAHYNIIRLARFRSYDGYNCTWKSVIIRAESRYERDRTRIRPEWCWYNSVDRERTKTEWISSSEARSERVIIAETRNVVTREIRTHSRDVIVRSIRSDTESCTDDTTLFGGEMSFITYVGVRIVSAHSIVVLPPYHVKRLKEE